MKSYKKIKPAFAECKNCIILCSDDGFMPATSVLIQSIFEQADSQKFYDIIIFHSNIRPVTEEIVQNMFEIFIQQIEIILLQKHIIGFLLHGFWTKNTKKPFILMAIW